MSVKILLERKFKETPSVQEIKAINEMRIGAMRRKGYISGETLIDSEDNRTMVVVSVWADTEAWKDWFASEERKKLEAEIDKYLEVSLKVRTFMLGG